MLQQIRTTTKLDPVIANNPRTAIENLYERHAGAVLRHCMGILGNRSEAEDALQETFIKAYRGLDDLRESRASTIWIRRIATNVCINMLRTQSRKKWTTKENIEIQADSNSDPVQRLAARQTLNRLLRMLDETDLQIVIDHYCSGIEQGEIAKSIGISRRAVVKRLTKMRHHIEDVAPLTRPNNSRYHYATVC